MNDALSDTSSEPSSSPDASQPPAPPSEDMTRAFGLHTGEAPVLSWLSALSALAAMVVGHVLVPAIGDSWRREFVFRLDRWADFAMNLGAISGLVALGFGLYAFVRYNTSVPLRQRMLLGWFSLGFIFLIAWGTLLERQRTTTGMVMLSLGAAYVLGALANIAAARLQPARYPRAIALLAATMATLTLVAEVLQLLSRRDLSLWQLQASNVLLGIGELCFLVLLVALVPLVLPFRTRFRDRVGRALAFFLLPVLLGGLYYAESQLQNEYALLLYHAQRVTLFVDEWPRIYSLPLALGIAASLAGGLSSDASRRQGAAGLCLLLACGFSPHAPGRLVSMALALVLIARTVIGPNQPAGEEAQA